MTFPKSEFSGKFNHRLAFSFTLYFMTFCILLKSLNKRIFFLKSKIHLSFHSKDKLNIFFIKNHVITHFGRTKIISLYEKISQKQKYLKKWK